MPTSESDECSAEPGGASGVGRTLLRLLCPHGASGRLIPPWVLGIALALAVFMFIQPGTGVDVLVTYGPAGRGQYIEGLTPRNPRFSLWLFWLLARLPWKWDYLALMLVSIPMLTAAVHWGRGDYGKAFLSFPFIWLLAYGQIDAFLAAGVALAWWSLQRKQFWTMGIGFALACMLKPQVGIFAALCVWLWSPNKWKPLAVPLALIVISLLQWGWDWPIHWIRATLAQMGRLEADWANASPVSWLGWWVEIVWVPVILVPMKRLVRLRAVLAATALCLPYFPAYELLILLIFPVSWLEWLLTGLPLLGGKGYAAAALMPLLVIIASVWPWARGAVRRRMSLSQ